MNAPRILVGVTGGIAAYKAVHVVRLLRTRGYDVHVVPTANALRMVGAATWEAVSGHGVTSDPFSGADEVSHVHLGASADGVLIVPATANFVAKLAHGIADDMLTTTVLATQCPVVVAPAMHHQMWQAPVTVSNVAVLRSRGIHIIDPVVGPLTSGDSGVGRLPEPEQVVEEFIRVLRPCKPEWVGKHVVVTAGGTHEPIDPVRFLGNHSSGRQGIEIAHEASRRGAQVTLIAAHISAPIPPGVDVIQVDTAVQMLAATETAWQTADVLVMAAAVADYRPAVVASEKLSKEKGELTTIELVKNPDILATLGALPRRGRILVGFAAETAERDDAIASARAKVARKHTDFLALNSVSDHTGFGDVDNCLMIFNQAGTVVTEVAGTKHHTAVGLMDVIETALNGVEGA